MLGLWRCACNISYAHRKALGIGHGHGNISEVRPWLRRSKRNRVQSTNQRAVKNDAKRKRGREREREERKAPGIHSPTT